jgi:hypothetical protein
MADDGPAWREGVAKGSLGGVEGSNALSASIEGRSVDDRTLGVVGGKGDGLRGPNGRRSDE